MRGHRRQQHQARSATPSSYWCQPFLDKLGHSTLPYMLPSSLERTQDGHDVELCCVCLCNLLSHDTVDLDLQLHAPAHLPAPSDTVSTRLDKAELVSAGGMTEEAGKIIDQVVTRLPCGHSFHANCIDGWFQKGKDCCPLCRVPVPSAQQIKFKQSGALIWDEDNAIFRQNGAPNQLLEHPAISELLRQSQLQLMESGQQAQSTLEDLRRAEAVALYRHAYISRANRVSSFRSAAQSSAGNADYCPCICAIAATLMFTLIALMSAFNFPDLQSYRNHSSKINE